MIFIEHNMLCILLMFMCDVFQEAAMYANNSYTYVSTASCHLVTVYIKRRNKAVKLLIFYNKGNLAVCTEIYFKFPQQM